MLQRNVSENSDDPFEAALASFRNEWLMGRDPDPDSFCRNHPEFGPALRSAIDDFLFVAERLPNPAGTIDERMPDELHKSEQGVNRFVGDFRLLREIGRGGMGVVYEAEQVSLRRRVALKILFPHLGFSGEAILKFRREAEAGGRQRHSGIVSIYAVGEHEGIHYIAEELVEGGRTLADRLGEFIVLDDLPKGYFRNSAILLSRVAEALQHAHDSGVIHRDIKPSNILLTREGRPKVSDFGLARIEDALTLSRTGDITGTPYYMSPEQAMSKKTGIDRRTDVYSLGVTLYEMLTLKPPFEGDTSHEVLKKIVFSDPEAPNRVNPKAPRDLSVICLKAMEKSPDRRYQAMREFADDLNRFLSGDVILAKPAGPATRMLKRMKRNPLLSAAVGTAALAVLALMVLTPWYAWSIKNRYEQIVRLSDVKRLSELQEDAEALWPAYPERILDLKKWITRAEELIVRLDTHGEMLDTLRGRALPYDEAARKKDREGHPEWETLQALLESRKKLMDEIISLDKECKFLERTEEETEIGGNESQELKAMRESFYEIEDRIEDLAKEVSERVTWEFDNLELKWQHDTLAGLVAGLKHLSHPETGTLKDVKDRLDFAETIGKRSILDRLEDWGKAVASIADPKECPRYKGLVIEPQIGLVPIGRDPGSGLWEFAHLQTGRIPERGPDEKLILTKEMGIVFVLIPGGAFDMGSALPSEEKPVGSPNVDPQAMGDESPVHRITLKPFFFSKYEMTAGQWLRFTGGNPSMYGDHYGFGSSRDGKPYSLLHPVEQVSWTTCEKVLSRLGLRLPSESEWEYAARAGTATVWWTGDEKESLKGAANICDLFAKGSFGNPTWMYDEWMDDGYYCHAPVGSFLPNPFGLHDICGNVWEWCQDRFESYRNTPIDGSAFVSKDCDFWLYRVIRGGSWRRLSSLCRSALRSGKVSDYVYQDVGVRPARSLEVR